MGEQHRSVGVVLNDWYMEPRGDYGKIVFRNAACRYRLTEKAVDLVEQDEDEGEWANI